MHVHAAAVVADDGFRHERQRLAVPVSHVLQRVFEDLHLIGFLGEGVRGDIDLALSRGGDLVMMDLELQAHFLAGQRHGGTDILLRVRRGHREIAAFHAGSVAFVAVVVLLAGVPGALVGIHLVGTAVHAGVVAHVVEDEEFVLGAEQRGVRDPGGLQVSLGTLRERPGIALVALHGHRLDHVAAQIDRGLLIERVDHGGRWIGHQDHVRLVDSLPTSDRRSIEHFAVGKKPLVHQPGRDSDVLFFTESVGKAEIGELGLFFVY